MDPGIRLATPHDAAAIAQVRVMAWRTTYRGMMPAAYLDAMSVEASATQWERILGASPNTSTTFVAEVAGLVVGFASGLMLDAPKLGFDAELSAVYLDREHQRHGVGRRLVARVAAAQRAHGATGLLVWVIAGNKPARAFYERLGAELIVEQPFEWDGMDLVEAGYGWHDLAALAALGDASRLH
ncbi:MAG: GNAT family N-acetyltransferase [Burkholderiales bacterium]|nr:GNAT family N-acetyltransferase [Burkholderiales bacterium]